MKILIVNNAVPFTWGGAEELALNLCRQINSRQGMEAEVMRIPFSWQPKERLVSEILANRSFHIHNVDRVIALKFPAYYVNHHAKTIWLLHQFRQAYDLLDNGQSFLSREANADILTAIREADNVCFDTARKVFSNSPVTKARLNRYNGRDCEVLYPPLNDEHLFEPGDHGDYIFAGGRIDPGKRQDILIEAAIKAGETCKLVVAGPAADQAYVAQLQDLIARHDVGHRITLQPRLHSREEIADLARHALACAYIPYDEDSLGYVTMEAAAAGRAIITSTDSGGILDMVRPGDTGLVAEPRASEIAEAFSRLCNTPGLAQRMGRASRAYWHSMNIRWDTTIERLVA